MKSPPGHKGLIALAIFKLLTGLSLVVVGVGALRFLRRDLRHDIQDWINIFRVDPENRYVAALLTKAGLVDDRHLKALFGLAVIYATLYLVEGTGLLFRQRWAEYLTVIATASFIPVEIYEINRHCTISRVFLLVGNIAIVAYLIWVLKQKPRTPSRG